MPDSRFIATDDEEPDTGYALRLGHSGSTVVSESFFAENDNIAVAVLDYVPGLTHCLSVLDSSFYANFDGVDYEYEVDCFEVDLS